MADLLAQCPADSATKKPTKTDVLASGAQGGAFTPTVIQAPACTPIEITFTNAGAQFGVFNNIAIPYGSDEWLFQGDKATTGDPVKYVIPPLPEGTYHFVSQGRRTLTGTIEILPD